MIPSFTKNLSYLKLLLFYFIIKLSKLNFIIFCSHINIYTALTINICRIGVPVHIYYSQLLKKKHNKRHLLKQLQNGKKQNFHNIIFLPHNLILISTHLTKNSIFKQQLKFFIIPLYIKYKQTDIMIKNNMLTIYSYKPTMLHRNTVLRVLIFANFLFIFIILLVKKRFTKMPVYTIIINTKESNKLLRY